MSPENLTNQKFNFILILLLISLSLSACEGMTIVEPDDAQPEVLQSSVERAAAPEVPRDDLERLVQGNNAFMLDLYQGIKDQAGNLFTSPYSISSALAMTYAGARGATEQQLAEGMHYTLPQDQLHAAFNALDRILISRSDVELPEEGGDPFQLNTANAIWGQRDFAFEEDFLETLARHYGAGLRLVDFIQQPEASRQTINNWVSQETQQKIQDLIPQGAIDPDTRLVLSNAIYFNAGWLEPFQTDLTGEENFTTLAGEQVSVPMMAQRDPVSYPYFQGEGFQAVELPYVGGEVSMLILLPDSGRFSSFEGRFSAEKLQEITEGLTPQSIDLRMPRFEFESEFSLAGTLAAMGMPQPFSPTADFSGMTGGKDLFISDVFHKAFVSVDEEGTEAAAATAVVMKLTSLPASDPLEVTLDRPFVFLIRDRGTGAVLFLGRVVNPSL
jgi:serpin B